MKFFLFALLCLYLSCQGHRTEVPVQLIDTAARPTSSRGEQPADLFRNAIVLFNPDYRVIVNLKDTILTDTATVRQFFRNESKRIGTNSFYVIFDSTTSSQRINWVVEVLKAAGIPGSKLLDIRDFTPSGPPKIEPPIETSHMAQPVESFSIRIQEGQMYVLMNGIQKRMANFKTLDQFIGKHLKEINQKQVTITMDPTSNSSQFKDLVSLLKKHGIVKFKVITE